MLDSCVRLLPRVCEVMTGVLLVFLRVLKVGGGIRDNRSISSSRSES
jgi:hypothetical protein